MGHIGGGKPKILKTPTQARKQKQRKNLRNAQYFPQPVSSDTQDEARTARSLLTSN